MAAQMRVGFGKPQLLAASLITIFLVTLLSFIFNLRLLLCLIVAPITVFLIGRWAANRLGGGLTGDVYGAICELVELLCLICLNIS
jgi:cobalamin synthase